MTCTQVAVVTHAVSAYNRRIYTEDFDQIPFMRNACDHMTADYDFSHASV